LFLANDLEPCYNVRVTWAIAGEDTPMQDIAATTASWMPLVSLLDERDGASLAWVVAVEDALARVIAFPSSPHTDGTGAVALLVEWRQLERELCFYDPESEAGIELRLHVEACRRVYRDHYQSRARPH
jgi:hypothetical protein